MKSDERLDDLLDLIVGEYSDALAAGRPPTGPHFWHGSVPRFARASNAA
jgi:hypothetical protein